MTLRKRKGSSELKRPLPVDKSSKPAPALYRAHRERQRVRILVAAQQLFISRGIDRTTMAELTAASNLQPSTMYEYFAKKDAIVWAVVGSTFSTLTKRLEERLAGASSGMATIVALLDLMADDLANRPEQVRFMAEFDAMYARHWPPERMLILEGQLRGPGLGGLKQWVRKGIKDGSLRPDLDPDLTIQALLNTVIATQRRLASLGQKVEAEYGQSTQKLFDETVRILLAGLQPHPAGSTAPSFSCVKVNEVARKRPS